jgi:hypothetical protein
MQMQCTGQWRAPKSSPPYSRAAATAFHRLPVAESPVIVDGALKFVRAACRSGWGTTRRLRISSKEKLSALVTASQNHAWPPARPHLNFQRSLEHFFEQIALIHFRGRADPQALSFVQ